MPDPLAGRHDELAVGLAAGLAAAAVVLAARAWWRRRRPDAPVPVGGLALAAAAVAGLAVTGVPARPGPGRLLAVTLISCAAGLLLADFDRRHWRDGLTFPLLAVTAAGIWATVPDVEAAVVVLGACLPMAVVGWPLLRSEPPSLGLPGALATAGVLAWTAVTGGAGRPGSVVGGLACLGLLAVEPIARRLVPGRRSPLDRPGPSVVTAAYVLGAQLLLVGVASRVVGRPAGVAAALRLAAAELAVAVATLCMLALRRARTSSGRRST